MSMGDLRDAKGRIIPTKDDIQSLGIYLCSSLLDCLFLRLPHCRLDYILLPSWRCIAAAILKKPPEDISTDSSLSLGKRAVLYISLLQLDSFAKQPIGIALFLKFLLRTKAEEKCNCSLQNLCTKEKEEMEMSLSNSLPYKQFKNLMVYLQGQHQA